ncbi:ACT domain-containing protein [Haloactinopolyspora sp.]|uniref:ACT domain-containing protein n=1 Tax=Haloactinopolyspora sp. TaxID=1966353 RepID=UPI002635C7A5|nr:ACT domain-containing protein [Haloactinopolyspora sp.]
MAYLLRVIAPDRPGVLGAVASAVGAAGGDIVGIDVVERRNDATVVDDFLVDLPAGRFPDTLVTACRSIEGVDVEFVGQYHQGASLHRDLEAVDEMTEDPRHAMNVLVRLLPGIFRSGWALLLAADGSTIRVEQGSGGAPEAEGFDVPWLPMTEPRRIDGDEAWAPESWRDVVAVGAPVADTGQVVVFGRNGGPRILDSEFARLVHLVALAQIIRRGGTSSSGGQSERQDLAGTGTA